MRRAWLAGLGLACCTSGGVAGVAPAAPAATVVPAAPSEQQAAATPAAGGAAAEKGLLRELFAREWEQRLKDDPLFATTVGRHEYDAKLPLMTMQELGRQAGADRRLLEELAEIEQSAKGHGGLRREDEINARIFRRQLEDRLADYGMGEYQMPFNSDSGFHTEFARLPDEMPFATARDYENYIARLRAWPALVDQEIALMRIGIRRGMTVPRVVLAGYDATISSHVTDDPAKSVFYQPFENFPPGLPAGEQERLRREGREAVLQGAVAGYRAFLEFFRNEYLPAARETVGALKLPNGPIYYSQHVLHFTTLELGADEIHRLGLSEVERISGEMQAVIKQVGFKGDFAAFLKDLRSDPRFYAKTPEELLKDAAWIAVRMQGKLPALFRRLPRLPLTVRPVPPELAPKYTSGRYVEAPVGSTQPGVYWVNTHRLETRPLYALEALTLHESVPGHHLQISLSQELAQLPDFRRYSYISAFGEGWGLYSEWLGLEAGFYTDPYSNFGRLTYEMWRACRLVVDTGLHAKGWTRQQAIDYLASHTALSLHEVETEIDRYISWPGQALAYKLGELKIKELRKRAETALGEKFDLREFHDVVLGDGSVPLGVLESNVDAYISRVKAGRPPAGGT